MVISKPPNWTGDVAIILAHGAGQGIDSPFMRFFHTGMSDRGFLSVAFNFEYMERGKKVPDPQPKMQALFRSVIADVKSEFDPRRIIIGGKSMGGRVASYIAKDESDVKGLVFLGYPLHPPSQPEKKRDAHLYDIPQPILFLSGTRDAFAQRVLLEDVVKRIGSRATLVWTIGGDHSLKASKGDTDSWTVAAERIQHWIKQI